ncbi:hypothetical protein AURDEDRAFT_182911 [Auricularia subglabra TFB-10046 SS5]|nr:hypothetical protein AURDEDRAFT_182911 [Auricularia subglabra TFB-10046 SS5]
MHFPTGIVTLVSLATVAFGTPGMQAPSARLLPLQTPRGYIGDGAASQCTQAGKSLVLGDKHLGNGDEAHPCALVDVDASHGAVPHACSREASDLRSMFVFSISDGVSVGSAERSASLRGMTIGGIIAAVAVVLAVGVWAATRYCCGSRPIPRRADTEQRGMVLPAYKPRAYTGEVVLQPDQGRTPAYDEPHIARSASPAPIGDGDEAPVGAARGGSPSLRRRTR